MWFDREKDNYFIVLLNDDSFSVDTERELSDRIDMADTGTMDDVIGIYKLVDGKLLEVKQDKSYAINTDEEMPFRYSAATLYVEVDRRERLSGGRRVDVGIVTFTDH